MKAAIPSKFATLVALAFVFSGVCTPHPGAAQDPAPLQFEPELIKVLETDSLYILEAITSPDGKWVALSAGPDLAEYNLFVVSSEGGELKRLTEGRFHDTHLRWAPDGLSIYFLSDRLEGATSDNNYITRIPFDPETGEATDVPRPVILEPSSLAFGISPDGEWLAYSKRLDGLDTPTSALKIAPAAGGPGVVVAETRGIQLLGWTAGGAELVYTQMDRSSYETDGRYAGEVWGVSKDGGESRLLFRVDGRVIAYLSDEGHILWTTNDPNPWSSTDFFITNLAGDEVTTFELPPDIRAPRTGLSPDLSVYSGDSGTPVLVVPVDGGPIQSLGALGLDGDALGWLGDKGLLVYSMEGNPQDDSSERRKSYFEVDLESGSMRPIPALAEFSLTGDRMALSEDGRFVFVRVDGRLTGGVPGSGSLHIVDLESGVVTDLFQSPDGDPDISNNHRISGPGGAQGRDGGNFFYSLIFEDRQELFSVSPPNGPELIWSFPGVAGGFSRSPYAIHGNRLAWFQAESGGPPTQEGTKVMLGDLQTGEVRELFQAERTLSQNISWSNDGTKLAFGYGDPGEGMDLGVLEISDTGEAVGDPVIKDAGARIWYGLRWLPGDGAVLLLGMGRTSDIDTDVLLVDVIGDGTVEPVVITSDDPYSVWTFESSPDGRYIAYASERPSIATLYRMRLPELGGH